MAEYVENSTKTTLVDLELNKRGSEFIRVQRVEDNATHAVSYDIRRWYYNDDDVETATHKGVRIKKDMAEQIIEILSKSIAEDNAAVAAVKQSVDNEGGTFAVNRGQMAIPGFTEEVNLAHRQ